MVWNLIEPEAGRHRRPDGQRALARICTCGCCVEWVLCVPPGQARHARPRPPLPPVPARRLSDVVDQAEDGSAGTVLPLRRRGRRWHR